uniref:Uncharacterized protein n=1 Tax=Panagrolaimus sp. JU765 TaxID=591449 RepID=A0AC34QPC3_9BILA
MFSAVGGAVGSEAFVGAVADSVVMSLTVLSVDFAVAASVVLEPPVKLSQKLPKEFPVISLWVVVELAFSAGKEVVVSAELELEPNPVVLDSNWPVFAVSEDSPNSIGLVDVTLAAVVPVSDEFPPIWLLFGSVSVDSPLLTIPVTPAVVVTFPLKVSPKCSFPLPVVPSEDGVVPGTVVEPAASGVPGKIKCEFGKLSGFSEEPVPLMASVDPNNGKVSLIGSVSFCETKFEDSLGQSP